MIDFFNVSDGHKPIIVPFTPTVENVTKYIMFIFQGNDFLNYNINDNNSYHKYINNAILHSYFKLKVFFNFYNTLKYYSHTLKKNEIEFKKVYEYEVNSTEILFKFDYIYNDDHKVFLAYKYPLGANYYQQYVLPTQTIGLP